MAKITPLHEAASIQEQGSGELAAFRQELNAVKAGISALLEKARVLEELRQEWTALQERLASLESKAHTDHAIAPEAVSHIVGLAQAQIDEKVDARVKELIGHSGLPARGDEQ